MNSSLRKCIGMVRGSLIAITGIALLSVAPAIAQMAQQNPGAQNPGAQNPGAPGGQRTPVGGDPMAAPGDAAGQMNNQMMEKEFVKKALQGGMAEVQLGQLALQKSSNDDVKKFAQRMVDDHTKLGEQMQPVAQQMNVKIPDSPSKKDKATMAKLQALNGDAFDKAYIKDMVKDHEKDQKDFKHESETATNPDLKQVATQGEQVITEHLQMIKQIAQKDDVVASK
jgi:putative membrane protein